ETSYTLQGQITGNTAECYFAGGSLLIHQVATGLVDEVFFSADGRFQQTLILVPNSDTRFILVLCNGVGDIMASAPIHVRHHSVSSASAAAPTLLRDIAIEVHNRAGQRQMRIIAPAGAALPGRFSCQCRTTDQCGRVVVPLWQDGRLVHRLIVNE